MRGPSRGSMKSSSPHVGARLGIARFQLGQRRSHCTAQASLAEQVQSWLELDTDPESVKEVKELQAANDESLLDRFGSRLAFGAFLSALLAQSMETIYLKAAYFHVVMFTVVR